MTLSLGPDPQYVVGMAETAVASAVGPVRPAGELAHTNPCAVIVRGQMRGLKTDKEHDCYLAGTAPCTYSVDAYNLGNAGSAKGTLTVQTPQLPLIWPNL